MHDTISSLTKIQSIKIQIVKKDTYNIACVYYIVIVLKINDSGQSIVRKIIHSYINMHYAWYTSTDV